MRIQLIISGLIVATAAGAQGLSFWALPSERSDHELNLEVARICREYSPSRDYSQNSEMYERYNTLSVLCERISRLENLVSK